jgi:AbrB family looped-hinge helix DNA binding protein
MQDKQQVYNLKVDASGRIVLPAEARARNHIAEGDTVVVVEDDQGLHVKTREQVKAEVQAYFATLAPPGVLLSEEILQDRRAEHERDWRCPGRLCSDGISSLRAWRRCCLGSAS